VEKDQQIREEGCSRGRRQFEGRRQFVKKKVICDEEGYLRGRLFARKKAICEEEEDCSTRTTNELVEEGGQWRRTNKFVKKVIHEEEGDL
jgi:hypothetical protein